MLRRKLNFELNKRLHQKKGITMCIMKCSSKPSRGRHLCNQTSILFYNRHINWLTSGKKQEWCLNECCLCQSSLEKKSVSVLQND